MTSSHAKTWALRLTAGAFFGTMALLPASSASAHSELIESTPTSGAELSKAPDRGPADLRRAGAAAGGIHRRLGERHDHQPAQDLRCRWQRRLRPAGRARSAGYLHRQLPGGVCRRARGQRLLHVRSRRRHLVDNLRPPQPPTRRRRQRPPHRAIRLGIPTPRSYGSWAWERSASCW